jgi:hypothetical protein
MFNLSEYTTVAERIKMFWEKYPDGKIVTSIVEATQTRFIVKAELWRTEADPAPFVTGHACEVISERGVNRDFALENCETSSVGIAAKNAGIGTEKHSISREEAEKVERVKAGQTTPDDNLWTVENSMTEITTKLGAELFSEEPKCAHGRMNRKKGISSKTGQPYSGWVCSSKNRDEQCEAKWDK